ncbi:hypothetical protein BDZ97DRAFT_1760389 [Flammula alnicola]|nr:hypothetical protein BDZ97DRAFT_1760389 [Flammula alnicola]
MNDLTKLIYSRPDAFLGSKAQILNVRNRPTYTWEKLKHTDKNTDLVCLVIGELLGQQQGTKFGASGNRLSKGGIFFKPMKDGEHVQDVMAFKGICGSNALLNSVWNNQIKMLNEMEELDKYPSKTTSWKGVYNCEGQLEENLHVLWEKYETVEFDQDRITDKTKTHSGAHYHPAVLPDFKPPYFNLNKDALKQHDIFDEQQKLVAPWMLSDKLQPGSLMLLLVSLHSKNVYKDKLNAAGGFDRTYEIRGHKAKVLNRGTTCAESPSKPIVPNEFRQQWRVTQPPQKIESFKGFTITHKRITHTSTPKKKDKQINNNEID